MSKSGNEVSDSRKTADGTTLTTGPQRKRSMSLSLPPMPWFGIDIGGTLTKLVYFEPTDTSEYLESEMELKRDKTIHRYLTTNKAYGETGIRDDYLQLNNVEINGRVGVIHFIRFPTEKMMNFIRLVKSKGFAQMSSTVCATGGGAIKYAKEAEKELGMQLHKADELESLIKGIEFVAANNADECYYYESPLDPAKCRKVVWRWSSARCSSTDHHYVGKPNPEGLQYPYVVCNIGSGVSVLVVRGHNDFTRVSGSSIGGGFFQGLCCLLCKCETFEEAIELATRGDNKNVDKLVGDIYGCSYDLVGLPHDTVAASFGKICTMKDRENVRREDLARSALVTTTNNIGSIALNAARQHGIDRIVFVGNFLRVNPIAARHLTHAMDFWSKGTKKALFLNHEGYFGAVGCLDKLVDVTETRRMLRRQNGLNTTNSAGGGTTTTITTTTTTPSPTVTPSPRFGGSNNVKHAGGGGGSPTTIDDSKKAHGCDADTSVSVAQLEKGDDAPIDLPRRPLAKAENDGKC